MLYVCNYHGCTEQPRRRGARLESRDESTAAVVAIIIRALSRLNERSMRRERATSRFQSSSSSSSVLQWKKKLTHPVCVYINYNIYIKRSVAELIAKRSVIRVPNYKLFLVLLFFENYCSLRVHFPQQHITGE